MIRKVIIATLLVTVSLIAPAVAQQPKAIIWRDPGDVSRLNLAWGEGGQAAAPKVPFTFVKEDTGGTNPKIEVRDARGVIWGVKWGEEVNAETFAARLVWAVGYLVEPSYFIHSGKILGVRDLNRAKKYVQSDGSFNDARFERKDKNIIKLSDKESWSYDKNPFVGSKELNGLKVMIMLLSNWDSKDQHHAGKGSNTKIFVVKNRTATEHHYVVSDWGGTMGKWGGYFRRAKWDCDGYQSQSEDLVKGIKEGEIEWGYSGQHTGAIRDNIPLTHVRWLLGYLGKITDSQLRDALQASGATEEDQRCFAAAVRQRIRALQALR